MIVLIKYILYIICQNIITFDFESNIIILVQIIYLPSVSSSRKIRSLLLINKMSNYQSD